MERNLQQDYSRLQEIIFIRGTHLERDTKLLQLATNSHDSYLQMCLEIQNYVNEYINFNLNAIENGVSVLSDPRVIFAVPQVLN